MWTGRTDAAGYGEIKVDGRKEKAPRVAYELEVPRRGEEPVCYAHRRLWVPTSERRALEPRAVLSALKRRPAELRMALACGAGLVLLAALAAITQH